MENKEKPKTKPAQLVASISSFSICYKTFAYLLRSISLEAVRLLGLEVVRLELSP